MPTGEKDNMAFVLQLRLLQSPKSGEALFKKRIQPLLKLPNVKYRICQIEDRSNVDGTWIKFSNNQIGYCLSQSGFYRRDKPHLRGFWLLLDVAQFLFPRSLPSSTFAIQFPDRKSIKFTLDVVKELLMSKLPSKEFDELLTRLESLTNKRGNTPVELYFYCVKNDPKVQKSASVEANDSQPSGTVRVPPQPASSSEKPIPSNISIIDVDGDREKTLLGPVIAKRFLEESRKLLDLRRPPWKMRIWPTLDDFISRRPYLLLASGDLDLQLKAIESAVLSRSGTNPVVQKHYMKKIKIHSGKETIPTSYRVWDAADVHLKDLLWETVFDLLEEPYVKETGSFKAQIVRTGKLLNFHYDMPDKLFVDSHLKIDGDIVVYPVNYIPLSGFDYVRNLIIKSWPLNQRSRSWTSGNRSTPTNRSLRSSTLRSQSALTSGDGSISTPGNQNESVHLRTTRGVAAENKTAEEKVRKQLEEYYRSRNSDKKKRIGVPTYRENIGEEVGGGPDMPSIFPRVTTIAELDKLQNRAKLLENEILRRESFCRLCYKVFPYDKDDVARHYQDHIDNALNACPLCSKVWSKIDDKQEDILEHFRSHLEGAPEAKGIPNGAQHGLVVGRMALPQAPLDILDPEELPPGFDPEESEEGSEEGSEGDSVSDGGSVEEYIAAAGKRRQQIRGRGGSPGNAIVISSSPANPSPRNAIPVSSSSPAMPPPRKVISVSSSTPSVQTPHTTITISSDSAASSELRSFISTPSFASTTVPSSQSTINTSVSPETHRTTVESSEPSEGVPEESVTGGRAHGKRKADDWTGATASSSASSENQSLFEVASLSSGSLPSTEVNEEAEPERPAKKVKTSKTQSKQKAPQQTNATGTSTAAPGPQNVVTANPSHGTELPADNSRDHCPVCWTNVHNLGREEQDDLVGNQLKLYLEWTPVPRIDQPYRKSHNHGISRHEQVKLPNQNNSQNPKVDPPIDAAATPIAMFDTVCTLPLTSDLFAQAVHPTESVLAVGLSAGHVQTFRLPGTGDSGEKAENGFGLVGDGWRTRRHKGSCRCLTFGVDGEALFSAGTDGLVKVASSSTGKVISKIAIPQDSDANALDTPCLLHALSPQTLLLATDSSALHLYDLRTNILSAKPQQSHRPHDDYISSLTPLRPTEASTSGYSKQWVTTGGTTLAVTDLRRGVLVRSEDQEEELLSSVFVGGLPARPGRSKGEKVLVGGAGGVLTLWERGVWDDQDERIIVDRSPGGGESLDTLALLPEDVGPGGKIVAVGLGDGRVSFVRLGQNRVIGEVQHDEVEGVVGLGVDAAGRLISGGGMVVKVWHEKVEDQEDDDEEEEVEENGVGVGGTGDKRGKAGDSDDDDGDKDSDGDSSADETIGRKRRKKRKRSKGKDRDSGKHVTAAFKGMD
ncbi:MAG: hypothetical protein M1819_003013 [Sarea resinae]|nr:MAG: hypothetical protein M1819_003013 [Sarea resinae]